MANEAIEVRGTRKSVVRAAEALFVLLGLLLLVDSAVRVYFSTFLPASPFSYAYTAYQQVEACPGDKLVYEQSIRIERVPSVVTLVETWASMDRSGATVIPDREERYAIHLREAPPFEAMLSQVVPDLPPGNYEFRQAGFMESSAPSGYSIRVRILDCKE